MTRRSFQTKTEIQAILHAAGLRPRRRHGQHFLIDGNLMNRLFEAAELTSDDAVLEIGPGTGSLTEQLVAQAGRVIAVEIDPALFAITRRRLADAANATCIQGDVLSSKHHLATAVTEALAKARRDLPGRLILVANLPYNIATPLLANLLLDPSGLDRLCFTVQREVADRFTASPGTKAYGPISIALQCTCRITRLALLPPQVFWPRPDVESAMLRVDVQQNPFGSVERLAWFMDLCRSAFAHRRKTLKYNLSRIVDQQVCGTLAADFDLTRRPESLTVDQWIALAQRIESRND